MSIKQPVGFGAVVIGGETCPAAIAISWPDPAKGAEFERFAETEFPNVPDHVPMKLERVTRPSLRKKIFVLGNGISNCGSCDTEPQVCPFRYTLELMHERATALGFTAMSVAELREAE